MSDLTAYRRVSSAGQVLDGLGLPVQEQRILGWAAPAGHRITGWQEDPGVSGKLDEAGRPGVMAVLDAIKAGESDGMVITDLGRLSRLLSVQESILSLIWKLGGRVFTVESGEVLADDDDDPFRTTVRQVFGAFFELERKLVIKRLRNGREYKISQGGYGGGGLGYGWTSVDGKLVADEIEQATRRRLVELRNSGLTLRAVADQLNAENLPPRRADRWYASSVQSVLRRAEAAVTT